MKAVDNERTQTVWVYKQIEDGMVCDADQMSGGTQAYTEGKDILFDSEDDNGTRVCFSVINAVGNTGYALSEVLSDIDQTPSAITVNNPNTDPAQEKAVSAIDVDTTETTWEYKQISKGARCNERQMSNDPLTYFEGEDIVLADEGDNDTKICFASTDNAGNVSYEISAVIVGIDRTAPIVSVTKAAATGAQVETVRAEDNDATETVWKYKQITASAKCDEKQMASGTETYTEDEEISFTKEEDNNTKVCFSSTDLAGNVGYERSSVLRNIDTTAPVITVTNPDANPAQRKIVSAIDNEKDVTNWTYKQITKDATCDADTMATDAKVYAEGDELSFTQESDNDTKVCFSSTDNRDNVSYQESAVLEGIDRTAIKDIVIDITNAGSDPSLASDDPVQYAQAKIVQASDKESTQTTWMYKQIMENDRCDEVQMQHNAKTYTEGTNIVFDSEDDNGTKVCFAITDNVGNTVYRVSKIITGIDTTAPTTVVTKTSNAVQARDTETTDTDWMYKKINGDLICDADEMSNGAQQYTEGEEIAMTVENDNGTKVCFSATDIAGNTSYQSSETISSIAITTSAWTDPALGGGKDVAWAKAKAVVGTDGNDTKTEWYYKQIAGDAVCNASTKTGATPYVEGTPIVLRKESDNGTKICFISINQKGVVSTSSSEVIFGIDTTAPNINITEVKTTLAKEKVLRAVDYDTDETVWTHKQIAAAADCTADQMSTDEQPYTENTDLTYTKESDNNTKVCFSATDIAGNTAYQVSEILDGIDASVPTVSSAILVDVERTQTKVVVTDTVHSFGDFSVTDFAIEIDRVAYPVKKVSVFEQSEITQQTSFVLTHEAIVPGASATLSYTASENGGIADSVGNALESFNGQIILDKSFVTLSLDPKDDTGISTTDGITRFSDDRAVTLIATISDGSLSNGDIVRLYKKGRASHLKEILISSGIVNATDAHGETAFTTTVPKSTFAAGEDTALYTVFIPADGSNATGQRGYEFIVSYRKTTPHITVTTNVVSAAMVTVQASDRQKRRRGRYGSMYKLHLMKNVLLQHYKMPRST